MFCPILLLIEEHLLEKETPKTKLPKLKTMKHTKFLPGSVSPICHIFASCKLQGTSLQALVTSIFLTDCNYSISPSFTCNIITSLNNLSCATSLTFSEKKARIFPFLLICVCVFSIVDECILYVFYIVCFISFIVRLFSRIKLKWIWYKFLTYFNTKGWKR